MKNSKDICYDVPVKATYRIIDGEPVMISCETADIPAAEIAKLLCRLWGVSVTESEEVTTT